MNRQSRLLIAIDDIQILELLADSFVRDGFIVSTARDGRTALQKCHAQTPDVVVLDMMLPVISGFEVCQEIRDDSRLKHVHVLMLTAPRKDSDEFIAFQARADDYLSRPFRMESLRKHVAELLRPKLAAQPPSDAFSVCNVEINPQCQSVSVDDDWQNLSQTECRLLWMLMRQPGRAFNRQELLEGCRGEHADATERTIDVHIRALRKKLGRKMVCIKTVRGIGYRFCEGEGKEVEQCS